jgi:hypothetical protein
MEVVVKEQESKMEVVREQPSSVMMEAAHQVMVP